MMSSSAGTNTAKDRASILVDLPPVELVTLVVIKPDNSYILDTSS